FLLSIFSRRLARQPNADKFPLRLAYTTGPTHFPQRHSLRVAGLRRQETHALEQTHSSGLSVEKGTLYSRKPQAVFLPRARFPAHWSSCSPGMRNTQFLNSWTWPALAEQLIYVTNYT